MTNSQLLSRECFVLAVTPAKAGVQGLKISKFEKEGFVDKILASILDTLKTSDDFYDKIFKKAYLNFTEDPSIFNAMIAVVSCHALCEWLNAEGKATWEDIKNNCCELRILISLSNHFKHKQETRNSSKPIKSTKLNDSFVTPDGDYQFGSFEIISDLKTEYSFSDGKNDLEMLLKSADKYFLNIVCDLPF
ncbi:hypothetical protein JW933_00850 [candidate division FCPU426 bacterium]|nr:hypothetical protein [candidate division FCPU426 bacterium]